ncbi:MAG: GNAT family N-acetyltransferase [Eubacteriales bacterium]
MEQEEVRYTIRPAMEDEWGDAMWLAWRTFLKYDASDYTNEGIKSFGEFITDETLHKLFLKGDYEMLVARANNELIGLITLRDVSHISLLFVREGYHAMGIGSSLVRTLYKYVKDTKGVSYVTVNAAPYAIGFYHALGFENIGHSTVHKGIIALPMKLHL